MTSADNTARDAGAPRYDPRASDMFGYYRPPPRPLLPGIETLDAPQWVHDYIARGDDPHDVLDTWESDLTAKRDKALADMAHSQAPAFFEAIIDGVAASGRKLETARKRLAELEAERDAAVEAAAEAGRERQRETERQRAAWEAAAPAREAERLAANERAAEAARARRAAEAAARRAVLDREAPPPPTMWGHLVWLRRTFGRRAFTTAEVCQAAADDPGRIFPPGIDVAELGTMDGARQLGMAYARAIGCDFDGARIDRGYKSGHVSRWKVTVTR